MSARWIWERLREAQDEFDAAYAERPRHCGSEQMCRDELAGDNLAALLDVVETAAVYRFRSRDRRTPTDIRKARDDLDAALHALDPENCPALAAGHDIP